MHENKKLNFIKDFTNFLPPIRLECNSSTFTAPKIQETAVFLHCPMKARNVPYYKKHILKKGS